MKPPYYDSSEDFYYFSPDYYKEFWEWQDVFGNIEGWNEDTIYDFVETVTGDKPDKIEFNKRLLFIKYTI